MNFRELVDKRESCRAYTGGMVERNDLDAILRAGCMSPSAKNTQPWKFYVVQYEKKEVLCEAIKVMGFNKFVDNAGAFIVIVADNTSVMDKLAKVVTSRDFIENDIGIAVASMTYQATDLGYGSCILGAFNGKEVCKAIGIDEKKAKDVKLILAVGKRVTDEVREKTRKSYRETIVYVD
ncbi:MAG: nitroreductase family protein [Clostridia bacterium]|nr:nitroreductase family protein [Clostridia bacterium]